MKNSILSLVSIIALSGLSYAGGDIAPIEEPITEAPVIIDDSAFYVGLGYSYISSNRTATHNTLGEPNHGETARDMDSSAHNMLLQAGYQFNQYLAVEGRYTFSVSDLSLTDNLNNGAEEDIDIDLTNIALYLKPMYPIGDLSVYGLLGYGKVERKNGTVAQNWDGSGFQWGLGAQYAIMDNLLIFADYTLWYDEEDEAHSRVPRLLDTDFSAMSVGLSYKF